MSRLSDSPTVLCFDYGLRRTGAAVGQQLTGTATPLKVFTSPTRRQGWEVIEQLLEEWQPDALVVGVPLTESGEEQPMTEKARRFARQLEGRFGLPVHEAEERYSSREAQDRHRRARSAGNARRREAAREDAVAAQIILEAWFASQPD